MIALSPAQLQSLLASILKGVLMSQTFPSPLENLAAFALTFVVGIVAAVALSGYLARTKATAQAHGCRYPSGGCSDMQRGSFSPPVWPPSATPEVGEP